MPGLTKALLWVVVAGALLAACLPSNAQARGCKDCGGHTIGVYSTSAPAINTIQTPWGQASEMVLMGDPVLIIYHCNCIYDMGGNPAWCDYYREERWGEGPGWRDEQSGGCKWLPAGEPGQIWCIDFSCTGSGAWIQLHPIPGT